MKNRLIFTSTCPACGQRRPQHGHTRRALIRSIETSQIIDSYCLDCDLVWPVSSEERDLIAKVIMIGPSDASPPTAAPLGQARDAALLDKYSS